MEFLDVRPATRQDASALVDLLAQLGYPADAGTIERRLDRLLPRSDDVVLVAEDGRRVIGLGALHLMLVIHEDAPRAQLTALVVAEAARGRGVGRAIVKRIEETALDRGSKRIVVTTANHRARTHQFYERMGYEWTGRRYGKSLGSEP